MKPLVYALVALSLLWIDVAYRAATKPVPLVVRVPISDRVHAAGYVVPVQECANTCRARARSMKVGK